MIKGVIFDMDGVLIDSEKIYLRFWREACAAFGFSLSEEQGLSLRSNSPETAVPKFKEWFGEGADYMQIRERRRKIMANYIDLHGVKLKDGAAELIEYLKNQKIKIALATASPIKRAEYYLTPHGLFDKFDAVTDGTMVRHSKPSPEIYIRSANALKLPPSECIAVEDSPIGIHSAHDAGCITVMIPDLTPPEDKLMPLIDYVFDSLAEIKNLI